MKAKYVKGGLWTSNRRFAFTLAVVRNVYSTSARDVGHSHPELGEVWDRTLADAHAPPAFDMIASTNSVALPKKFAGKVVM